MKPSSTSREIYFRESSRTAQGLQMACNLPSFRLMRIKISCLGTPLTDEKRAYAEYRFFTSIAPHVARVRGLGVVVSGDAAATGQFRCTVAIDLGPYGLLKTQARAAHPTAAIDRAADRTAWLVNRRIESDVGVESTALSS